MGHFKNDFEDPGCDEPECFGIDGCEEDCENCEIGQNEIDFEDLIERELDHKNRQWYGGN